MNIFRTKTFFILLFFVAGVLVGSWSYFLLYELKACEHIQTESYYLSRLESCYAKALTTLMRRHGLTKTVAMFRKYLETPNGSFLQGQRCHALAHEIGNAAARSGISSRELLSECINMCLPASRGLSIEGLDLGCMNGAAHTWLLLGQNVDTVSDKCNDENVSNDVQEGCFHGIGHGLHELYGGDIPREIEECKKLSAYRARYQCAHAVFMESQAIVTENGVPLNSLAYCQSLPKEMSESCYEFAGYLSYSTNLDPLKALGVCRLVPVELQLRCRKRVGQSVYLSREKSADVAYCIAGDDQETLECILGFVRGSIETVNDGYGKDALGACQLLPAVYKKECYSEVGLTLESRYGSKKRQASCEMVKNADDRKACL